MQKDSRLHEELIQNNALEYLNKEYSRRSKTYAETERYTVQGKKADGLFCFLIEKI